MQESSPRALQPSVRPKGRWAIALLTTVILAPVTHPAIAAIYGPEILGRPGGRPATIVQRFESAVTGEFYLEVYNGGRTGGFGMASGEIHFNGSLVIGASELGPEKPPIIRREVRVKKRNRLVAEIAGGRLLLVIGKGDPIEDPLAISSTISPQPNAAGWNRTPVTIAFHCYGGSGVSSCTEPVVVSSEGANQTVTGTAVARNGLTVTTRAIVNIDRTPPSITSTVTPAANAAGWHRSKVTVGFVAADALSGVGTSTPPVLVSSEGAGQVVEGVAYDLAGNRASTSQTVNLDRTAPVLTPRVDPPPNRAGWNREDVSVDFVVTDVLSGVEPSSEPTKVLVADEGTTRVLGQAVDLAGNSGTALAEVKIDQTPPVVDMASPIDGATVDATPVAVTGSVRDHLSGVATANLNGVTFTSFDNFDLKAELMDGFNDLTVSATDLAGNDTEVTVRVNLEIPPLLLEVLSPAPGPRPPLLSSSGWSLTLRISAGETLESFFVGHPIRFPTGRDRSFLLLQSEPTRNCIPPSPPSFPPECTEGPPFESGNPGNFLEFRLGACEGNEDCSQLVPGLVLLSNSGIGWVFDAPHLTARNLAEFVDLVTYELRDSRGQTSVTVHLNVPYGLFAPRVQLDTCVSASDPVGQDCSGNFLMRVDGGEVKEVNKTAAEPGKALSSEVLPIYASEFDDKEFVVRALVVNGTGPMTIPDSDVNGVVDAFDVMAADPGYELLAEPVEIRFRQLHRTDCAVAVPDLLEVVDLDMNAMTSEITMNTVCANQGDPGELQRPPEEDDD